MILKTEVCRFCESDIESVINFGKMPIANGFISSVDLDNEYFFNLEAAYCPRCTLFQLVEMPDPKILFNQNYAYHSGESNSMQLHFSKICDLLINKYNLNKNHFCVEIGNNDGGIVEYLNLKGFSHLGVDPSKNVSDIAKGKGINVLNDYFSLETSNKIIQSNSKADFILAANALAHIPDLYSVFSGIENLLTDKGIFITEDPYLLDVLNKTSYDQIYDEHVFIFSLTSMQNICNKCNLEIFDVEHVNTAGGSLRYFISKKNVYKKSSNFNKFLNYENDKNLLDTNTYKLFSNNCLNSKNTTIDLFDKILSENNSICGYGATSKSTTIFNYCNIDTKYIKFITDTTKIKQNKLSPGMHIPIYDYEYFQKNRTDYCFLLAWNLKDEIFDKEKDNFSINGQWITHIPTAQILK